MLDVYLYDRAGGSVTLVSQTPGGALPNKPSVNPSISADGTRVVFESLASDLVAGDANLDFDLFLATVSSTGPDNALRLEVIPPGAGSSAALTWSTSPGATYQVERRESLASGEWQPFGAPVVATGAKARVELADTQSRAAFFRVKN
jgi:hypothetical protein